MENGTKQNRKSHARTQQKNTEENSREQSRTEEKRSEQNTTEQNRREHHKLLCQNTDSESKTRREENRREDRIGPWQEASE